MPAGKEEEDMEVDETSEELGDEEEEEEDDEGGDEEDEEEEAEQLEPKVLPQRATRAQRLNKLLEEEDSADEDFWNQDFFAEEGEEADKEFKASESEEEDVPDSDFSESEEEDDEDEEQVEARMRKEERSRRKALKPPGAAAPRKPPQVKPPPAEAGQPSSPTAPLSPNTRAAIKVAKDAEAAELFKAPTLRKSTRRRVEEAEKQREFIEQSRPRKRRQEQQYRPLTQEELLAEAAQTEIENLRSLEALQAAEEEVKKRAAVKRARYNGPYIRYQSKKIDGEALTTLEAANMLPPPYMQHQVAPQPKERHVCVVTGQPACYQDPLTGLPYHNAAAFKVLRQQYSGHRMQAPNAPLRVHGA